MPHISRFNPKPTKFQKIISRLRHTQPMRKYSIGAVLVALFIVASIAIFSPKNDSEATNVAGTSAAKKEVDPFASVDAAKLSPLQTKIFRLLKQEYAKSPESYDATVLKYSEGFKESWCADFISWIMNEADSPNISNETGYWRIPGVQSLQTYYMDINGYVTVDDDYIPQLGDVVFYIGSQTPDNNSSEHAALVLSYDSKTLVTIGGNEGDGVLRIRSESLQTNIDKGLVGYGILE